MRKFHTGLLAVFALASSVSFASAAPFTLTTTLTGDPRLASPDGLEVLVKILGDTTENVTWWTVDLAMGDTHPDARLDEFGFNLAGSKSTYTFGDFNLPYSPINGKLNGSGGTQFLLTLNDPNGNASDATNLKSLSFSVTKTSNFSLEDFVFAPVSCSNEKALGCSQMGAHIQALTGGDSGVAVGGYNPPNPTPVPEPTTLMLAGSGLVGLFLRRSRRTR